MKWLGILLVLVLLAGCDGPPEMEQGARKAGQTRITLEELEAGGHI